MTTTLVEAVQTERLDADVPAVVQQANAMTINSPDTCQLAAGFLRDDIKKMRKRVDETFDDLIDQAHKSHKALVARKRTFTDPLDTAERTVKGKMSAFMAEEERKRAAEEARLRKEAEERQRAEAEAARRAEEERRLNEAAALEAAGHQEAAQALIEEPVVVPVAPPPAVIVPSRVPRMAGVSPRETWKFRIIDESKIPREFLMVNESAIGAMVRSQKGQTRIPGVEVYPETVISARAG